jgi:hypothetical protein
LTEDGVLLVDRDGFMASLLGRVRASLARLDARRVRDGSVWYWETRPTR